MIKYNEHLDDTIVNNRLPSGLNCYIIPKEMYNEKRALITVRYGSVDTSFKTADGIIKSPLGVAHFLEHKLFDNKNGNAFDSFSKFGAYVNAFTSFNNTAYYFSCGDKFVENLNTLLGFVTDPYFTDETIRKEMGIIEQEISMYDDNPGWAVYFGMLSCLYENHPAMQNIAGTSSSIKGITKDILYNCYENFYVPENMYLICSGNINADDVMAVADKYFLNNKKRARTILPSEKDNVHYKKTVSKMNISRPIFQIGFKERYFDNQIKNSCIIKLTLDLFIGESSALKEKLVNENLADDSLSFDYVCGNNYGYATISGECKDPEEFLNVCVEYAHKIIKEGFLSEEFDRIKKKQIGRFIRGFNSIEAITNASAELAIKGSSLFDCYDIYKAAHVSDCNNIMKELFRDDGYAISVVTPE